MNEQELRSFLCSSPRPAKILVRCSEGDHELAPAGPGRTWASIAHTILSLDAQVVEVYDSAGNLARARRIDEEETKQAEFAASLGIPAADNETARLTHVANLIYRAHEFSTSVAFSKMVELFEMVMRRAEGTESRLERLEASYRRVMQERIDEAFDKADEAARAAQETSGEDGIVGAFIKGALTGGASPPNGSAK